jgi:hypothetical protein
MKPRGPSTKTANLNSPNNILFAIQRKTAKFLQKIKPQLVTQFPVCLRVLPFSEPLLKTSAKNSLPIPTKSPKFPQFLAVPIIKGPQADSY